METSTTIGIMAGFFFFIGGVSGLIIGYNAGISHSEGYSCYCLGTPADDCLLTYQEAKDYCRFECVGSGNGYECIGLVRSNGMSEDCSFKEFRDKEYEGLETNVTNCTKDNSGFIECN